MAKKRHEPVRTCTGCREEGVKTKLIRIVRKAEGGGVVDRTGRAKGRGAYVHDDSLAGPIWLEMWPFPVS